MVSGSRSVAFLGLRHRFENRRTDSADVRFGCLVRELTDEFSKLWWETPDKPPVLGQRVPRRLQRRNHRNAKRLIDRIADEIERYPGTEDEQCQWRERVRESVQQFGEDSLGWPEGYRNLLLGEEYYQTTAAFVRSARAFDPHLRTDDLGQALRNVWITNSLQLLLDLRVRSTPSIFAYSMLYPYTDNLLDDPRVPVERKKAFNRRLGRRLAGEAIGTTRSRERQVFRLVERIEGQYCRREFPELFHSLLAIHRAQVRSLSQQRPRPPSDSELWSISVEKGGTSVLADGYLAAGKLGRSEASLCFGYGVFLQLLDDLQDVRRDMEAGHATLFTRTAEASPLDGITGRLHGFMCAVLEGAVRCAAPRYESTKDLIRRNCTSLLANAVGDGDGLFTPAFRRELERCWPFDFASMKMLRQRVEKRSRAAARKLRRTRGTDSLLDLLLP